MVGVVAVDVAGPLVVLEMGGIPGGSPSLEPRNQNNTKEYFRSMLFVWIKLCD